jgi:hypothetical protein
MLVGWIAWGWAWLSAESINGADAQGIPSGFAAERVSGANSFAAGNVIAARTASGAAVVTSHAAW